MFCPKCGKETDASGKFCQWCGTDIESIPAKPVATPEEDEGPEIGVYAGLGRRFIAFIVDMILVLLSGGIVIAFFSLTNGLKYAYFMTVSGVSYHDITEAGTLDAALAPVVAAFGMLIIVVPWLYFTGFESSRSQDYPRESTHGPEGDRYGWEQTGGRTDDTPVLREIHIDPDHLYRVPDDRVYEKAPGSPRQNSRHGCPAGLGTSIEYFF